MAASTINQHDVCVLPFDNGMRTFCLRSRSKVYAIDYFPIFRIWQRANVYGAAMVPQ